MVLSDPKNSIALLTLAPASYHGSRKNVTRFETHNVSICYGSSKVFIGCEAKVRDDDLTLTIRPHAVVFIMRFFSEQLESTSPASDAVATKRHLRSAGRELNLLTCKGLNPTFTSKIVP